MEYKIWFLLVIIILMLSGLAHPTLAAQYYGVDPAGTVTVNEWSECRQVTNQSGYPKTLVPTNTSTEWSEFRVHYPSHISLASCGATLTVTKVGLGTVTSSPSGINCGSTCSYLFGSGTSVTLTAVPDTGYGFSGWSGACSGGLDCQLVMDSDKSATATFLNLTSGGKRIVIAVPANDKIYVFGDDQATGYLNEYDPATNGWVSKSPAAQCRGSAGTAIVSSGTKIHALGGQAYSEFPGDPCVTLNSQYNPATNTWTSKAPMAQAQSRWLGTAVTVNNKIYVIGGTYPYYPYNDLSSNYMYDPATNMWTVKASMPTARFRLGATVYNNLIYVIGGENTNESGVGNVKNEQYNPATNTWSTKANMPTRRRDLGVVTVGSMIYAIGGQTDAPPISDITNANEQYNPATNTWTSKAPMITPRAGFGAAVVNNKIYTFCGCSTGFPWPRTRITEEYNPATNTWTSKAPMP